MTNIAGYDRFTIKQKITMMVNRYEIRSVDANGGEGPVIAMAQQKRMAFKEQVTFYADEARTQPVFGFKARQRMDLAATYDITDASGTPIGSFRKEFAKSLLRSTWQLTADDGLQATGTERNQNVAIARRLWEMLPIVSELPSPFLFHFDFTAPDGSIVLSSVRRRSLRDRYDVELPTSPNGWRLDWRVGAAMAVALDALQSR
ncbi:MAG: LURP-one-related/scramblase family protein [Dermatophilaceae bacterium]